MTDNGITGFFGYFLRSHRVTFLLIVALAVVGVSTALSLPRESAPEIDVPFGVVVTAYPGASARDVEELVTKPIEEALENLAGVAEITSTSRLGFSSIGVEFSADENLAEARRRLREAVDTVTDLPAEAELPEVIELDFNTEPIITVGLGGIDDIRLLTIYADTLADDVRDIPGVSEVNVIGGRAEEVIVRLDPRRLAAHNLTLGTVIGALTASNVNVPFGQLSTEAFNYDLRLEGRFAHVGDVADIPIPLPTGTTIPLDQLADVSLGIEDGNQAARISVGGADSTPSVSLNVIKQAVGNVDTIARQVRETVRPPKPVTYPTISWPTPSPTARKMSVAQSTTSLAVACKPSLLSL